MRVAKRTPYDIRSWPLTARADEIQKWRRAVVSVLRVWEADDRAVELAVLGVSELLSNVIKHVRDRRCRLRVVRTGEQVSIQLFDRSPAPPVLGEPAWDSESGRGLWLLRETCPQVGWEAVPPHLGAKRVWFTCWLTNENEARRPAGRRESAERNRTMSEMTSALWDGFIDLPRELEEDLIEIGSTLPAWSVEGTFLADSTIERYRAKLDSAPLFGEVRGRLLSMLRGAAGGYAVVRLGNIAQRLGVGDQFLRLATAILVEVGTPFQPFLRWPLWKEIGTNLNANPGLSTGTGYNAFHMDLVNATQPPDYTTLLCVRPDPLGAGTSILSDARAAVSRLTPSSRLLLADAAYSYGSFFDLSDVGEEYKPFPVLDGEPTDLGFVRFTAKMLAESGLNEAHARAAKELADQMVAGQVSFTLQRGDVLIVNQHRWVHGREPLGGGQHDVAPEDRRLLLQPFLRSAGTNGQVAS